MAWLASDGFDFYSAVADLTQRWDSSAGTNALVAAASTAFGIGGAFQFGIGGALTRAWGSNDSTVYLNLRHKQTAGTLSTAYAYVQLLETAGAQVTLRWNEDGSITVHSGGVSGTTLGTYSSAFSSGAWDSWQVKIVIHNTTGSVEIRKNGNASPIGAALTGVNTRAGTVNAYANKVTTGATTGNHQIDDLFLNSGTGADPATWPGDLRAITNAPNATAQAQFSQSPSSTTWGQTVSSSALSSSAANGILFFAPVTAPFTGTVSQLSASLGATLTGGKLNMAIYDATGPGGGPGALLAQGTEKTAPAAGSQVFTLGSTVSAVKGTVYHIAIWTNVSVISAINGGGSSTRYTQALAYAATFPSAASATSSVNTMYYAAADLTAIAQYSLVSDSTQDGDTSYLFSATVGQEDLFSFPTLASLGVTPAAITGVLPFAICKKSDSGARTIDVRAKSGVTDTQAATTASPSLSYSFLGGFLPTDPNTSAAWTTGGVDALQVGPKVAA